MSSSFAFEVVAWPSSPCARYFTTPRSPAGKMSVRPRPLSSPISAVQRPTPRNEVSRSIACSSESGARLSSETSPEANARADLPDRDGFRAREAKAPQARQRFGGQRLRRGKRDVGLAREAGAATVGETELAADVVGELEVDLLRQDRGHERLPQRRDARDAEPSERPDRRAENRVGAMRPVKARHGRRGAERAIDDAAGRLFRGSRTCGSPLEPHVEHGPGSRPELLDREEHPARPDRKEPPVHASVEAIHHLGKPGVALGRQGERVGTRRHDREANRHSISSTPNHVTGLRL